jgi:hypothetical protein
METLSGDPVSSRAIAVASFVLLAAPIAARGQDQPMQHKSVMLMNRIGPSASTLYVANADGSDEDELLAISGFDYHAS